MAFTIRWRENFLRIVWNWLWVEWRLIETLFNEWRSRWALQFCAFHLWLVWLWMQLFCGEFVKRIKLAQNQAFCQCSIKKKVFGLLRNKWLKYNRIRVTVVVLRGTNLPCIIYFLKCFLWRAGFLRTIYNIRRKKHKSSTECANPNWGAVFRQHIFCT